MTFPVKQLRKMSSQSSHDTQGKQRGAKDTPEEGHLSKPGKGEWAGNRMVTRAARCPPHSGPTAKSVPWTTFLRLIATRKGLLSPASKPAALPTSNLDFKGIQINSGYLRLPQADDSPSAQSSTPKSVSLWGKKSCVEMIASSSVSLLPAGLHLLGLQEERKPTRLPFHWPCRIGSDRTPKEQSWRLCCLAEHHRSHQLKSHCRVFTAGGNLRGRMLAAAFGDPWWQLLLSVRQGNPPASGSESKRIRQHPALPTRKYSQGSPLGMCTYLPSPLVWGKKAP